MVGLLVETVDAVERTGDIGRSKNEVGRLLRCGWLSTADNNITALRANKRRWWWPVVLL